MNTNTVQLSIDFSDTDALTWVELFRLKHEGQTDEEFNEWLNK